VNFVWPLLSEDAKEKQIKVKYINSYVNKIKCGCTWMTYYSNRDKSIVQTEERPIGLFTGYFKLVNIQPRVLNRNGKLEDPFLKGSIKAENFFIYSNLVKDKEALIMEAEEAFLQNFLDKRWFTSYDDNRF
jgi:hypothetical protein